MPELIRIPAAPGELLDKITILQIKAERITDPERRANVVRELELLQEVWRQTGLADDTVERLQTELRAVNEALWEIEDGIRDRERAGDFGERFIELARSVYFRNDERAAIKKRINRHLGSEIVEEKNYREYRSS